VHPEAAFAHGAIAPFLGFSFAKAEEKPRSADGFKCTAAEPNTARGCPNSVAGANPLKPVY
jgi:hypothetical protein